MNVLGLLSLCGHDNGKHDTNKVKYVPHLLEEFCSGGVAAALPISVFWLVSLVRLRFLFAWSAQMPK